MMQRHWTVQFPGNEPAEDIRAYLSGRDTDLTELIDSMTVGEKLTIRCKGRECPHDHVEVTKGHLKCWNCGAKTELTADVLETLFQPKKVT